MPNLPDKSLFTGAAVTEGGYKTSFDNMIDFLTNTIGITDGFLTLSKGTTALRPAATTGGFLRFNTDRNEFEASNGVVWDQLVRSIVDATYKYALSSTNANGLKIVNTGTNDCHVRVEGNAGTVDLGVDTDEAYLASSGVRPLRIWVNGVPVFKVDSSGNLTVTGTITQKGTV